MQRHLAGRQDLDGVVVPAHEQASVVVHSLSESLVNSISGGHLYAASNGVQQ